MKNLSIINITKKESLQIKKEILEFKKNFQSNENNSNIKNLVSFYQNKLEKIKNQKENCLEKFNKRKITKHEYDIKMKAYELEGYITELDLLNLEQQTFINTSVYKRLNYLYIFLNLTHQKTITDPFKSNEEFFKIFSIYILKNTKSYLELDKKRAQLYILINKSPNIPTNHKYCLSKEEEEKMETFLFEERKKSAEINQHLSKIPDINISNLTINDFFNEDLLNLYNNLFNFQLTKKL